jgi:hypothetical protein
MDERIELEACAMLDVREVDRPAKRKGSRTAMCAAVVVGAFVLATAVYYIFNVNQVPSLADKGAAPSTVGQGANER